MASRGRPSGYTDKIAEDICFRLAEGQSMREICRDPDMPSQSMVYRWLSQKENFREQYTRAKEAGIEVLAEDILDIADNASNDWMDRNDSDNPGFTVNMEHIQRSKLRIESRKWLLSKMVPKKYGDRMQHSGEITEKRVEMSLDEYKAVRQAMLEHDDC